MKLSEQDEYNRKACWYQYFLALREKDELKARHFRKCAQHYESKKKRWIAEQLPLI